MKHKIFEFSPFPEYMVLETGDNISAIIDKMIRLAAKLTEYYAGDIVYDINALETARALDNPFDRLLLFREHGVTTLHIENDTVDDNCMISEAIQIWRLSYTPNPSNTNQHTTSLIRARLSKI